MKRFAAALLAALPFATQATTVMVMSISGTRVELLVNNSAVRSLRPGEVSPEGVKLIEISAGSALVEVDGKRWQMRLGAATASSVVLQADERGHFVVHPAINGVPVRALVDTGASSVAMNLSEARRARVDFAGARRVTVQTAAGPRPALLVRLASVQLGELTVYNVEATVSERDELPITLLGMSFLGHLEMQSSGRSLTLTRRH